MIADSSHRFFSFILIGMLLVLFSCDREPAPIRASISAAEALQGNAEGYLRADRPREFVFPEDHGPHPGYRTEWWYYTGNLFSEDGDHYGYQFTIFRTQLLPHSNEVTDSLLHEARDRSPSPTSANTARVNTWQTDQLYMGHFAISQIGSGNHLFEERFSRGAVGLAGSEADPFRVWLEDWSVELKPETVPNANGNMTMLLSAAMDNARLTLELTPAKPIVFHGKGGYDKKGEEDGNASYYLSFTRLQTNGHVTVDDQTRSVSGYSWMDHEWSSSALEEQQTGWDWFSMQFDNGMELMYYQLREENDLFSPYSTGTLITSDGETETLGQKDINLQVVDHWVSPVSGARYPVAWRLSNPERGIDLSVNVLIREQEMNVSVRYYEGAIEITGVLQEEPVSGYGYVEMTGY